MVQQHIVYSDSTCNQRCPTPPAEALGIFVVFGEILWLDEGSKDPFKGENTVFALFFSRLCYKLFSETARRLHTAPRDTPPQGKPVRKQTPRRSIAHVARDLARAKTQTHSAVKTHEKPRVTEVRLRFISTDIKA